MGSYGLTHFAPISHCLLSLQEDTLQFFKREQTSDAVYDIYLKKVLYHTPPDDVGIRTASCPNTVQSSTFYRNIPASITKFQIEIGTHRSLHTSLHQSMSACCFLRPRIGWVATPIVIRCVLFYPSSLANCQTCVALSCVYRTNAAKMHTFCKKN